MGFADRVRDLLSGGSGKHQKPAHGRRGGQAHPSGSRQEARADEAVWHAADTPAADQAGQAGSGDDQTAGAAGQADSAGGQDRRSSGTEGANPRE